jgi:hypothetical protein
MSLKDKILLSTAVGFGLLCVAGLAFAQTSWQQNVVLRWDPLPASITKVQVFLANASISDDSAMPPTFEVTGSPDTAQRVFTAFAGGAIFARVKACEGDSCSVFSNQARLDTPTAPRPGPPRNVTITLQVEQP